MQDVTAPTQRVDNVTGPENAAKAADDVVRVQAAAADNEDDDDDDDVSAVSTRK